MVPMRESRAYLETGDWLKQQVGIGPFVVNKDGNEVWFAGTANPAKDLDDYAREHGYPAE